MIARIIEFSARRPALVLLSVLALSALGWVSMGRLPLDVLPELGDSQVIVSSRWDASPQRVEDQVTAPLVGALTGAPGIRAVRGISEYGGSSVYVIFEDSVDLYWARARVLEILASVRDRLPEGVRLEIGPDGTSLGWIYQYALVCDSGETSVTALRAYQDWYLRRDLKSVQGVADVATVGGASGRYQVNVDPDKLRAYGLSVQQVAEALKESNQEAGGGVLNGSGAEYMVRGLRNVRSAGDLSGIAVLPRRSKPPVFVRDVADVTFGPAPRRAVTDLNGNGDAVSGIVIMRSGANALDVISRVKDRLAQAAASLPPGTRIVPVYDRSELIVRAIANLRSTLIEVVITVVLIVFLLLGDVPTALIPSLTIPAAVLITILLFRPLGLTANIMTLGGIAMAAGAMVDAAIVIVEQTHRRMAERGGTADRETIAGILVDAMKQVSNTSFFALLIIAISFLPLLALEAQEGRLFRPLVLSKSLAMGVAALLTITLDPALRILAHRVRPARARFGAEAEHPIVGRLIRWYGPVTAWTLSHAWAVIAVAAAALAATVPVALHLGSEFLPPLSEGTLLYMPTASPGISVTQAQVALQAMDRDILGHPSVAGAFGKAGRADTPTDPSPLSMIETVITLKPEDQRPRRPTWYASWSPDWLRPALRHITADTDGEEEIAADLDRRVRVPGFSNAWTKPIRGRIEMLSTGIRTPLGLKIRGGDARILEETATRVVRLLQPLTPTGHVIADRLSSGYFLDISWDSDALARRGLSVADGQAAVRYSIGGEQVATVISGAERYPVSVRYRSDSRADPDAIRTILVTSPDGMARAPISEVAAVQVVNGPSMLRNEDGLLTAYVIISAELTDIGEYMRAADAVLRSDLRLPPGYSYGWSGEFESDRRVKERLTIVAPLVLLAICVLLYANLRSLAQVGMVLLAVPFSGIGAFWLLWLLGYKTSVAVWVGLIALFGIDAETGTFMLLYLNMAYAQARSESRLNTRKDFRRAAFEGAVLRIRPKVMTFGALLIGLLPVMWSHGVGSEIMKRIAAPIVGGLFTSVLLELLIYPPMYEWWQWSRHERASSPEIE